MKTKVMYWSKEKTNFTFCGKKTYCGKKDTKEYKYEKFYRKFYKMKYKFYLIQTKLIDI